MPSSPASLRPELNLLCCQFTICSLLLGLTYALLPVSTILHGPSPGLPSWQNRPGLATKAQSSFDLDIRKQVFSVSILWINNDLTLGLWPPTVCFQTATQLAEEVCFTVSDSGSTPLLWGYKYSPPPSPLPPACQKNLYYYLGTDHRQWLVPYQQSSICERMKIGLTSVDAWLKTLCDMSMLIRTWRTALLAFTLFRAQSRLSKLSDSLRWYKAGWEWLYALAKCKAAADWLVHFLAAWLCIAQASWNTALGPKGAIGPDQTKQAVQTYQLKGKLYTAAVAWVSGGAVKGSQEMCEYGRSLASVVYTLKTQFIMDKTKQNCNIINRSDR